MDAVVLTYPGHFFSTALCLRSLRHFYPDIKTIYILCDDLYNCDWENYFSDCQQYYSKINYGLKLIPYSNLPGLETCEYGWWRQQLVKLNLDRLVPGDSWFVIDGDLVLDQRIDLVGITPVHVRGSPEDPMTKSVRLYIDKMLGQPTPPLTDQDGKFALTSSVPFRHLIAANLKELRDHMTVQLKGDPIQEHIHMFYSGEIVAFDPTSTYMVMHEWELIEAYNHLRFPGQFSVINIGSGYHLDTHTSALESQYKYRINPYTDSHMGLLWFQRQHLFIPEAQWEKASKIKK